MDPMGILLKLLNSYEEGRALLQVGNYQWKIKTRGKPKQVWISETDSGNIQVCQGNVNTYGASLTEDGFILHANVKSNLVEISWRAIFDGLSL